MFNFLRKNGNLVCHIVNFRSKSVKHLCHMFTSFNLELLYRINVHPVQSTNQLPRQNGQLSHSKRVESGFLRFRAPFHKMSEHVVKKHRPQC